MLLSLVAFGWLRFAAPRPVEGVRIFGGALQGASHASLRVETLRHDGTETRLLADAAVELRIQDGAGPLGAATVRTDDSGMAWVEIDLARSAGGDAVAQVRVGSGRWRLAPLGEAAGGAWTHDVRSWTPRATRKGTLHVEVTPETAVFAVPFSQQVHVTATLDDAPVTAKVELRVEGRGRVETKDDTTRVEPGGRVLPARFLVEPGEHDLAISVEARAATDAGELSGSWYARVPVVPGAMHARNAGDVLRVRSPVAAARAFVAVVDERFRRWGSAVHLETQPDGTSEGEVTLPSGLASEASWAVVSSDAALRSQGAVGWPIGTGHPRPAATRTAPETLLADSLGLEVGEEELRQSTMQRRLFGSALLAGMVVVSWLVIGVRLARKRLGQHLSSAGVPDADGARLVEVQRARLVLYGLLLVSLFAAVGIWFWIYWLPI